jgi:hypothetical protein
MKGKRKKKKVDKSEKVEKNCTNFPKNILNEEK